MRQLGKAKAKENTDEMSNPEGVSSRTLVCGWIRGLCPSREGGRVPREPQRAISGVSSCRGGLERAPGAEGHPKASSRGQPSRAVTKASRAVPSGLGRSGGERRGFEAPHEEGVLLPASLSLGAGSVPQIPFPAPAAKPERGTEREALPCSAEGAGQAGGEPTPQVREVGRGRGSGLTQRSETRTLCLSRFPENDA